MSGKGMPREFRCVCGKDYAVLSMLERHIKHNHSGRCKRKVKR